MRKGIDLIWGFLDGVVPTVLFLVVTVMVITDVFLRNLLGTTIPNGIEISTYAFVWFIFLGAAGAARKGEHFQVAIIQGWLGARARKISNVLVETICTLVAVLMAQASFEYTARSWGRVSEGLELPLGYFYMIFPVCFGLMALAHLVRAGRFLRAEENDQ